MNSELDNLHNTINDIKDILNTANDVLALSMDEYLEKISEEYGADFSDRHFYYTFMCGALQAYLNLIKERINKLESKGR